MHKPLSIPRSWICSWPRRHDLLHLGGLPVRRVVVLWCETKCNETPIDPSQGHQPRG